VYSFKIIASSHHYSDVAHFADHGIEISGEVKVNLEKMIARKQAIVDQTTGGVKYLMDKNKITVLEGLGSFVDATHVAIAKADGTMKQLKQKNIIINGIEAC
jgi:dihydrolipoamide dehydrogenase